MPFLSIELGKHRFKVLLLERAKDTLTILHDSTLIILPDEDFKARVSKTLRDFIRSYDVTDRKVFLAFSDPSVITLRNAVLPMMSSAELVPAILWHAKEEGLLTEDTVLFNYEIVKEFTGEDEAKKLAVIFSVVNRKLLENSILMLKRLGLQVLQASAAPLNTVKVLAGYGDSEVSKVVLDLGYAASTLSIYKKQKLLFLRTLSISYMKARFSLNDPMFLGSKFRTPEAENEIEQAICSIEIPKEEYAIGSGENRATQFFGLLRPTLEALVREIHYSLSYFTSHYRETNPDVFFLTGHATKMRGLDAYLSRELGMTVSNLNLPPSVRFAQQAGEEDAVRMSQCVSAVAGVLPGEKSTDFMPFELKKQKFEAFQRSILKMASLIAAGICVMSFVFANLHAEFLQDRLRLAERDLLTFGKFAQASARPFPKYHLTRELEGATIPPDKVLRLVGHLMPGGLAIRHFEVDSAGRSMAMDLETSGLDEGGNPMVEDLIRRLRETGFFKKIDVKPVTGYSVSVYRFEGVFRYD